MTFETPHFESDGSYWLIVRPTPVPALNRKIPVKWNKRRRLKRQFKKSFLRGYKTMKKQTLAVLAGLTAFASNTFAAVPAEVTSALGESKSDAVTIGGLVMVIVIAIFAFKMMKKSL